jgi:hypothetical protein
MKHNYQNIIKKTYAKPVIEEVMLDYGTILMTPSTGGEGDIPEDPDIPLAPQNPYKSSTTVDYGSRSYEPAKGPFGDGPTY